MASILLISSALLPSSAWAQDAADLSQELAAMRAEVERLSAKVAELEGQQSDEAKRPPAEAPTASSGSGIKVTWKGAPEISGPGGWSFKPRGRLQVDTAVVDAPATLAAHDRLGWSTEVRRAFLGVEGDLPGGFGYRMEADFAGSAVELTDVFLTYEASPELTFTMGHHKTFSGLEELTSDLFTSMLERAAFNSAFEFERRVGVSGTYSSKAVMVQLGAFTDHVDDLGDSNDSYSLDGRIVFAPEIGSGTLHLGASAHFRELGSGMTARYRARPFVHTTDVRLVDTGELQATGERSFGAELAYINGPFHATVEGHQITALRPGQSDPTFWGGYAEIGLLLTPGDTTAYRAGAFDRIKPVHPVSKGGPGAIQVNARYDKLDLTDANVVGGEQDAAGVSFIWIPTDYVRFILNYGHLWIANAAAPAGTDRDYQADVFGARAQFDF